MSIVNAAIQTNPTPTLASLFSLHLLEQAIIDFIAN